MFKRLEKIIIRHSPTYNLLRFTVLPDFLVEQLTRVTEKARKFYGSFLTSHARELVFDVGANKGNKVKALVGMGYEVIAIEPEKKSLKTLKFRFSKNERVRIVEKGLAEQPGKTKIFIAEPRSGFNTMSDKWVDILGEASVNRFEKKINYSDAYEIELTTLDMLIAQYGIPYFIKIDVEGYENKVIRGLSVAPDFISFETNLPEFLEETKECIAHLQMLSGNLSFNYSINDQLELKDWITAEDLLKLIHESGLRYMEIICSLK